MAYPSDSDSDEARLDELYYGEADMSNANLRKYNEQVRATGGYDVDDYPGFAIGKIFNIQLTQADHEELTPYAEKAIDHFNEQSHANFKFLELLKANVQACCGVKYYLTFKAKDVDNEKIETFQGLYWQGIPGKNLEPNDEVVECRIKPATS